MRIGWSGSTLTSPYVVLHFHIIEFSRRGEVLLVGDFNVRIGSQQTFLLDFHSDLILLLEVDTSRCGVAQLALVVAEQVSGAYP